jgi:hypothetical protein
MASNEELEAARAAKAAIDSLSISAANRDLLSKIRTAQRIAIVNLSSGGHLNEARQKVGIALSNLIQGPPSPEKVDKATATIEAWIRELEAAKP